MLLEGGHEKAYSNAGLLLISIVIVTRNAALVLQDCLSSIYEQSYHAIEIIVIDGQSTDETIKILEQNSARITYWRSEKDDGIYDAMNKALKYCNGDWIYFIGADDVLFDGFSQLCCDLKNPDTIYYGRVLTLGGPTFPVSDYQFVKIGICHQAMIYPKGVFKAKEFDTRYQISADYAFNISLYKSSEYHFEFRDHLVAKFNHTGVSSVNIDKVFEKDRSRLVLNNFGPLIWLRYQIWKLKKARRNT